MRFLRLAIISFLFALVPCNLQAGKAKPNVLFIGVDDLRPELNCYGKTHIISPNIDRLAAEGVLFERAYCQWALCMPSRASLLSGLRPDTFNGDAKNFRKIVPDVVTMPQHFKNSGYFTQSIGKIYHGAWETAYVGSTFQDPVSWSVERWSASPQYYFSPEGMKWAREVFATATPRHLFLGDAKRDSAKPDQWKEFFVRGLATEAPEVADNVPADGKIADTAIERLRELAKQEKMPPFFLAVGFQKPHLPFVAPKKYWDLYDPKAIPSATVLDRPKDSPKLAMQLGATEVNQYSHPSRGLVSPERTRHLRHGYAACVSYIDAQIGRLLEEVDSLGLRDNTIVVLWSDHGYKLGDFSAWSKTTNFEFDTRVPLIIRGPGLPKGERSEALVELVDLHPTLSELAGLPVHPGAEGESIALNVREPKAAGQDAAFSQTIKGDYTGHTIRSASHRYTEWRRMEDEEKSPVEYRELYEYGEDLIERVNLADQAEHSGLQEKMRKHLAEEMSKTKPQTPLAVAEKTEDCHANKSSERTAALTLRSRHSLTHRSSKRKPNIILIFSDDQGYGELGSYGGTQIPTPHTDSIARNGVRFTDGYVTGPVCAPSRAGLLTGRYQQRFGCEDGPRAKGGLPHGERLLSERLKALSYATGMVGKWHLGSKVGDRPIDRGFDEFFGFLGGAHFFMPGEHSPKAWGHKAMSGPILRNEEVVEEKEYLTDAFGREAVSFIERHRDEPFFLYLPFNAVHVPLEASQEYFDRFPDIKNRARRTYAAMTASLENAVGDVLETVRKHGLEGDTLIFYISDNGGHPMANTSQNGPLRGQKGTLYEGGIRVPFLMQWKSVLPAGVVYHQPVTSLDVYATALAAAGGSLAVTPALDGVDLLPHLLEENSAAPHDSLYGRFVDRRAARKGDWKIVQETVSNRAELYNLANDISESHDLAKERPDKLREMKKVYEKHDVQMKDLDSVSLLTRGRLVKQGKWPLKSLKW